MRSSVAATAVAAFLSGTRSTRKLKFIPGVDSLVASVGFCYY